MINVNNPEDCCGCTACASICQHNAITMVPDSLGFLYPVVEKSKCVECGLCESVCQFNADYDRSLNLQKPDAYGARHKNISEVETSRSGAAFIAISDWILAQEGVVYGAGYVDHFRVVHKRAINKRERDDFKGSKYVQSDLSDVFRQVKQDLKNGMIVLFSGTPCQTAGLNSYIGKKLRTNLYLVDIVCHGVPSPYIWRDYLSYLEDKQGDELLLVNFRDKQLFGWTDHRETFKFKNGEEERVTWFTKVFYQHIMFRHSCGNCHYCNTQRPSDITIADFWGWEKTNKDLNKDDKGVSLVLVNTEKGRKLWDIVQRDMDVVPTKIEDCLQPNLKQPSAIHRDRMKFEKDYAKKGFKYVYNKTYYDTPMYSRIILFVKKYIKNILIKLKLWK